MKVFITGTDTNVGKTVISAWLSYHLGYAYWKPIQTGSIETTDTNFVSKLGLKNEIYSEKYLFNDPVSPHLASEREYRPIVIDNIIMPDNPDMIIEGAGGVFVPICKKYFMLDLIKKLNIPVIIVARAGLGTINHSLLTIEALKNKQIPILGLILNEESKTDLILENKQALEYYGQVPVLACLPNIDKLTPDKIKQIKIPDKLKEIIELSYFKGEQKTCHEKN